MGILAGRFAARERLGLPPAPPPPETAMGALLAHITGGAESETFQPMNVNFGLFPPLPAPPKGRRGKRDRARAMTERAKAAAEAWLAATHGGQHAELAG
jgi:methylenetetrahydrofolate--tRNA-(uracil-5-)-methyltransferase